MKKISKQFLAAAKANCHLAQNIHQLHINQVLHYSYHSDHNKDDYLNNFANKIVSAP